MTTTTTSLAELEFFAGNRERLLPPPPLRASEWASENIMLERGDSPRPGPLNHANAPYLPGICDAVDTPGVTDLTVMKAAQVGVSAAMRWRLGYWAERDPEPTGLVLPDKDKGEKIVTAHVVPMFKKTAALAALSTGRAHDAKKQEVRLNNGFVLYLMWSGSPSALASFPMRAVVADEVDKFQEWSGREAHPVHLAKLRTRAYGDRARMIHVSTPTTRLGMISELFELADTRLYFTVPCPHCGTRQRLILDQVKWETTNATPREQAAAMRGGQPVWYECRRCNRAIEERQRRAMIQDGTWATIDEHGYHEADAPTRHPRGTHLAMHISALYCTWTRLADIAAEYALTRGNVNRAFAFRTGTLGEVFESRVDEVSPDKLQRIHRESPRDEGTLAAWTATLIMTVDTQIDHFYVVIRAWGPGMRSHRVYHTRAGSFDELDQLVQRPWGFEDPRLPAISVRSQGLCLIDSGGGTVTEADEEMTIKPSRTQHVYQWALPRQATIRAIKGLAKPRPGHPIFRGTGVYVTEQKEHRVPIWLLDTDHFQTYLAELMNTRLDDGPAWQLNKRADPDYHQHLMNMHKVTVPDRGGLVERWVPLRDGVRVDWRDCEVYSIAGAHMAGVHTLPDLEAFMQHRIATIQHEQRTRDSATPEPPVTGPGGVPYLVTNRGRTR